jgi:ribulose-phosphate 3-epimerase
MIGNRDLQVDGGIDDITAKQAVEAGANVLVAGSYIYRHDSYLTAIDTLKQAGN